MEEIQRLHEKTLLQSLESTFCSPMEDFVKREVKTIRKVTYITRFFFVIDVMSGTRRWQLFSFFVGDVF